MYEQQSETKYQTLLYDRFPVHPSNPGNFKLVDRVNCLFDVYYSSDMILLQDEELYYGHDQFLKRFYELQQFSTKIQLLSDYYRFHQQFPRIFIEGVSKIVSARVEDKRTLQYDHVKRKMKEGQCVQPLITRRTIEPQERMLADIEVSYEDFERKSVKKQNRQKQLKRVISVHCKDGNGFRKQCKEGIFLNHRVPNKITSKVQIRNQHDENRKINVDVKAHQACLKKQKTYYKQSMKVRKDSTVRNSQYKIHKTNSSQAASKNNIVRSANVSSASSLSRSKSKNNLLGLHNFQKYDMKGQDIKEKKKQSRDSNPVSEKFKLSKVKGIQTVCVKSTVSMNNKKSLKSQSCKTLKTKPISSVYANNANEEKVRKSSIDTQDLMKALQKPINNMFTKVIQARKR